MLSIGEMEILKSALEGDIIRQKKQLEEIDDVRFEMWLHETEALYRKVSLKLFEIMMEEGRRLNDKNN